MKNTRILDKHTSFKKYAGFEGCKIIESGKCIRFILAGSATYDVPLKYFLLWNSKPHYVYQNKKWIRVNNLKYNRISVKTAYFKKWRPILLKTAVRVYLSNDTAYDIPWDTVLMACEPKYEHFGGFTKESKNLTQTWNMKYR